MFTQGNSPCFCHHLTVKRMILIILTLLTMSTIFTYFWLPSGAENKEDLTTFRKLLDNNDHLDLKRRIEELLRIKSSVQKDLVKLEEKRSDMQKQMSSLLNLIEDLKKEATKHNTELEKLRISIEQAKIQKIELAERNTPELRPPLRLRATESDNFMGQETFDLKCTFGSCFDLKRCPLSSGFPVYFYNNWYGWTSTKDGYGYLTKNPDEACLFVAALNQNPKELEFWKGDGRNHLLIDVSNASLISENLGKAMIASDSIKPRIGFDILVPSVKYLEMPNEMWSKLPNLLPVRRKYLVSYQEPDYNKVVKNLIEEPLNLINDDKTSDKVIIDFHCKKSLDTFELCGSFSSRQGILTKSNFALILTTSSLKNRVTRINEALESGSIPVFICFPDCQNLTLPFDEVIDYSLFSIFVPIARVTELHFLLRSFPDTDLFKMKRQGRLIWQNYLGSGPGIMSSILNLVRTRAGLPAAAIKEEPAKEIFDENFKPLHLETLPIDMEPSEFLGPLEPPMGSPSYRRNFSFLIESHSIWNEKFLQSSWLLPFVPDEPWLPAEAKFLGSNLGFRPVAHGQGGSGKEFSQVLGGNSPSEQFTVVMLTYEREPVLMDSLSRLYGLPYLNKVIVVWNSEIPPSPDLKWPEIGVPILVLKTKKNSLNNR